MAEKKKKKEEEKAAAKSSTHTTSSNTTKGGRGGSFGTSQTTGKAASSQTTKTTSGSSAKTTTNSKSNTKTRKKNSYTRAAPASAAQSMANIQTVKDLAQAQRGLASYEADRKKQQSTAARKFSTQAPADAPKIVHDFYESRDRSSRDESRQQIGRDWTMQDKMNFGYLYDKDPKAAKRFAADLNDAIAD